MPPGVVRVVPALSMKRPGSIKLSMLFLCSPALPTVFVASLGGVLCIQSTQAPATDDVTDCGKDGGVGPTVTAISAGSNFHLGGNSNGEDVFDDSAV
jgi:hypothetical protein